MKYIKYEILSGEDNMRIDSELLEQAIANNSNETIFRLYGWSPKCISLGRNQKGVGVNIGVGVNETGIDVVRRVTGGRALLHDDEITYSCVIPVSKIPGGESVIVSYKYISGYLIKFFKTLGIELDFGGNRDRGKYGSNATPTTKFDYCMLLSTGADVCFKGKKIIGSAQFRKNGYILQHGSILFNYDKELLENLFHEEVSNDKITTVNEILPQITKEEFIKKFENFISKETL